MKRPLEGILVLEFCQFLAGPSAGLKLADLGARVIKIERPEVGDACRQLAIKNLFVEDDSLLFHTINRNKESYAADLKSEDDRIRLKKLISHADIMIHNFRSGVMEKAGFAYEDVRLINPKIIYGIVSGYGNKGPWASKPGQDLLVQAMSGLTYLSGSDSDGPVPFGLSVSDIMCGNHLVQGLLAALIKRARTGNSVLVEVSLLESVLDVQFEVLTTYLNDGGKLPERSRMRGSAHAYLSAPYGIYETADGHLSLAMGDLDHIAQTIGCDLSEVYKHENDAFSRRDEIISCLGLTFQTGANSYWLKLLEENGIWSAEVLDYQKATALSVYEQLGIAQELKFENGKRIHTTVSPIRIDEHKLYAGKTAPRLGSGNEKINCEFELN